MTITAPRPSGPATQLEWRPSRYPGVRILYNREKRRVKYMRECGRCGVEREVHDPKATSNRCWDCFLGVGTDG